MPVSLPLCLHPRCSNDDPKPPNNPMEPWEITPAVNAGPLAGPSADPASCGESGLRLVPRAGRAAHLEAVGRRGRTRP